VLHRGARLLECFGRHLRECRPELPAADAELLCWAALSVFGSAAVHRTRIAKRRHVDLLVSLALVVVYADLSAVAAPSGRATPSWARDAAARPTRRETLLAEATGLFRRRGFHAVSIEEIGQAAGLAPASVYRHFSGKTDLLLTACRRMADRLAADAERVVAGAVGPWEALETLLASYAQTFLRNVDLVAVYLTELPNLPGPERTELERLQRAYVSRWVALLRAAQPELDESAARVAVHAALTVVNDLARTRQVASRPALAGELELLGALCLSAP
jgi:AcrR family transcriptional regulator